LKNARFLNMSTFEEKNAQHKFTIPTLDEFKQKMASLKIGKNDIIVCYESAEKDTQEQSPFKWACRAAWIMQVYGCTNIKVLDGGLPKWKNELLPLETGKNEPVREGSLPDTSFRLNTKLIKYLDEINRLELEEYAENTAVIDARPSGAFANGSLTKKAVNILPGELFDLKHYATLKPIEARQLAFATKIAGNETDIIFTCQRGIVASLLYVAC